MRKRGGERFFQRTFFSENSPLVSDFENCVRLCDQTTSRGFIIVGGMQNMKRQCEKQLTQGWRGDGERKTWAGTEEKKVMERLKDREVERGKLENVRERERERQREKKKTENKKQGHRGKERERERERDRLRGTKRD